MKTAETIIFVAFSVANACRLLAYLPQISVFSRKGTPPRYRPRPGCCFPVERNHGHLCGQVVADTAMALTFMANTLCCGTIVALVHYKRRKTRRANFGCAGVPKPSR